MCVDLSRSGSRAWLLLVLRLLVNWLPLARSRNFAAIDEFWVLGSCVSYGLSRVCCVLEILRTYGKSGSTKIKLTLQLC